MERKTGRGAAKPPSQELEDDGTDAGLPDLLEDELDDLGEALADPPLGRSTHRSAPEPTATDEPIGAELAADLPVQVVAVLGKKTMVLRDILGFHVGQVLDLGRPPTEVVDLVANGKLIAKGELVEVDGKLGVRILKLLK